MTSPLLAGKTMMRLSLTAILLACVAAPALAATGATPLRALGNPGEWVTPEDYPTNALRNDITGQTSFRLTISADGNVADCAITESSGSEELDARTCELLTRRARFAPARDEDGEAMVATYSNRVRWQIPKGFPVKVTSTTVEFDVEPDGSVINCKVQSSLPLPVSLCDNLTQASFMDAPEAERGRAGRRHVVMRDSTSISDPPNVAVKK